MSCKNAIAAVLAFFVFSVAPRAQEEEPIKESISVVNVEVPVRVFSDGQSVSGLTRDDFEISEGGKPQAINGFYVFHKKIKAEATAEPSPLVTPGGRYFVLIFRTYACNDQIEKGLQYLFQNIFRPDDQLFIMANTRTLMIERLAAEPDALAKLLEVLRTESQTAHNQMLSTLRSIEQSVDMTKFRTTLRSPQGMGPDYVSSFLQMYLKAWQEFKRRYLTLELDRFYNFSRHLQNIKREKWVFNFYQLEQFPKIAMDSEMQRILRSYVRSLEETDNPTQIAQSRIISRLLQTIESEMLVAKDFPSDEVSKLFYKVNATFHSFFMRAVFDSGNQEMQFRDVASDIENSLKALTAATGGTLAATNEIDKALEAVSERADDFYVLTYEPSNAKKVGKIKVTVRGKKYKVLYDDNIRADYITAYLQKKEAGNPTVKVSDLAFENKKLSFLISDFSLAKVKDKATGMLSVRIRVVADGEESLFDQTKDLQADKNRISLNLGFSTLAPGRYDIIIDVLDRVSGKTATAVIQPVVR